MADIKVDIKVDRHAARADLESRGVFGWPTWSKEESEFPWTYDEVERCYFLEGEVIVTPDGGEPVAIKAGDFATFPSGMSCTWKVTRAIRKHYSFGD